jgi:lysophospholipase L1-like esterase
MRWLALALALAIGWSAAAVEPATATKKPATKKTTAKKRAVPKPPPTTPEQRAEAQEAIHNHMGEALDLGIQNAAAMVPFYEMLYRARRPGAGEPLRILQFGDSHTASDDWAGALRSRFQAEFGDGGPGFVYAGRPFAGYRHYETKSTMSRNWRAEGLLHRDGDGLYGLGGISLTATRDGEWMSLEAEGENVEVFYLRQPGGGSFSVEIDGQAVETVATDGEASPGFWRREVAAGPHQMVLRTVGARPVRAYGWVVEKKGGVTWETLGINGAQADLMLGWNQTLLESHLGRRKPALIVLAYGTNESRRQDWTEESYRAALGQVIQRLRAAAPTASILLVGAPDQALRSKRKIVPFDGVDPILAAQRAAALDNRCAFWNWRSAMGGKGSMKQWVQAGLAQGDFVHLTPAGYKLVGDSLYALLMDQFQIFLGVRQQLAGPNENGTQAKTH